MNQKSIDCSSSGDNILHDVATGDKTFVFDYTLIAASAVTAILKDEAGTVFAKYIFNATELQTIATPVTGGLARFKARGDVILNLSGAVAISGHINLAATE